MTASRNQARVAEAQDTFGKDRAPVRALSERCAVRDDTAHGHRDEVTAEESRTLTWDSSDIRRGPAPPALSGAAWPMADALTSALPRNLSATAGCLGLGHGCMCWGGIHLKCI